MKKNFLNRYTILILFVFTFLLSSCSSVYYATWEKLGKHKRDLLRENVQAVREEQAEAQEQFKDALTRLKELTGFDGGELEELYNRLNDDYEECEAKAEAIRSRIDKINGIAQDLFLEWTDEIDSMSNTSMKRKDRKKLDETKRRFKQLSSAMERSEKKLDPVLSAFHDHVLYLKHNLNARAVAGLQSEVSSIEIDINDLIRDMDRSIAEADKFIKDMEM